MKNFYENKVFESMQLVENTNKEAIDAVMQYFGFNKKEAKEYIKNADNKSIQEIVKGFKSQGSKAFFDESLNESDDVILQKLKDNVQSMLDIYYIPNAEAEGFDTSTLQIGTPKIIYQDEYTIQADVPVIGPNGKCSLNAELYDEDGKGNYTNIFTTYDSNLAYDIISEYDDYDKFKRILQFTELEEVLKEDFRSDLVDEINIQKYLSSNHLWADVEVDDGKVLVHIDWGDWKHDHGYCKQLMKERGYTYCGQKVTEEDGSDTYSATHLYIKNNMNESLTLKESKNCFNYKAMVKDKSGKGLATIKGKIHAMNEQNAEDKVYEILTIDYGYNSDAIKKITVHRDVHESAKKKNESLSLKEGMSGPGLDKISELINLAGEHTIFTELLQWLPDSTLNDFVNYYWTEEDLDDYYYADEELDESCNKKKKKLKESNNLKAIRAEYDKLQAYLSQWKDPDDIPEEAWDAEERYYELQKILDTYKKKNKE